MKTTLAKTLLVVLAAIPGLAQIPQGNHCDAEPYENNNQVEPPTLVVQQVSGVAVLGPREALLPGLCVAVFTAKDHRLVATTVTDDNGRFHFSGISPGDYRLTAKYPPLCSPNVHLRVVKHAKDRSLKVHMKAPGIDQCGYVDFAAARHRFTGT